MSRITTMDLPPGAPNESTLRLVTLPRGLVLLVQTAHSPGTRKACAYAIEPNGAVPRFLAGLQESWPSGWDVRVLRHCAADLTWDDLQTMVAALDGGHQ
jgi:hypothetical protein